MAETRLPDGLSELQSKFKLSEIMGLIERTARWVDPETFYLLPLWYPEHARRAYFYKANWSQPQINKNRQSGHTEHKREGNLYANKALTQALGLQSDHRTNWSCCHIWSIDDGQYQESNAIVQDRRYYSCVANMVLVPTPLKAFTDTLKEVKTMLRICARHLYGWYCPHKDACSAVDSMNTWNRWSAYPESWPRSGRSSEPRGIMKIDERIRKRVTQRLQRIRIDLAYAGPHYPRDEVRAALSHWKINL